MKFSVITVVYNGANLLERAIQSVLKQKKVDIEYIIIDGGSTDSTCEVIKRYEDRIAFWESTPDKGVYDAMNKGLTHVTGDIVVFLGSDDWFEDNAFVCVQDVFERTNCDIVYGRVRRIENNVPSGFMGISEEVNPDRLHVTNLYCHQGLFVKNFIYQKMGGFNLKYKILADYDWSLRAYNNGYKVNYISDVLANFNAGGLSDTADHLLEYRNIVYDNLNGHYEFVKDIENSCQNRAYNYLVKNNVEKLSDYFRGKQYYIWGAGKKGEELLNLLQRANVYIKGFIDSNSAIQSLNGVDVYSIGEIDFRKISSKDEEKIIISSIKYEAEIFQQLMDLGIPSKNIIKISDIKKWALSTYNLGELR